MKQENKIKTMKTKVILIVLSYILIQPQVNAQGQGNMFGNANNWNQLGNQGWTRSNASIISFNNGVLEIRRNNNNENARGPIQLQQHGNTIQFLSSLSNGANGNNFHFAIQILDTNLNEHFSQNLSGRAAIENGGVNHVFFIDSLPYSGAYIIQFTYSGAAAGNSPATLFIENASYSLMPVQYQYIKAKSLSEQEIEIQWATTSEQNNLWFEIEKKIHGTWTQIGTVEGSLNSFNTQHYSFIDHQAQSGINLYRIIQVDTDGTTHASKSIEVQISPLSRPISAYPNPTQGAIQITGVLSPTITVKNKLGTTIKTFNSQNTIDIQDLPNGTYYLIVEGQTQASHKQTLIIQKF